MKEKHLPQISGEVVVGVSEKASCRRTHAHGHLSDAQSWPRGERKKNAQEEERRHLKSPNKESVSFRDFKIPQHGSCMGTAEGVGISAE